MEYWEFLLQKEGDQAWLPLESSLVEILEGRYRVMVHTSQLQVPVQIRISQRDSSGESAKRRVLKRDGETNQNGLMVVMPFTWLRVGSWEIHCTVPSPQETDVPPAENKYAVQLQVLSHEDASEEDWITDPWAADEPLPTPPENSKLSQETLATAFQSIDQALAETVTDQEAQAARGLVLSSQHQIELAQSALVARQGGLTVVGQVSAVARAAFPEQALVALRLLDPQTGKTLTTRQQSVFQPGSFAIPISLPGSLETQLLLGEVALVTPQAKVLAVQRFTVTVDLTALIDAIANQAELDEFDIVFPEGGATAEEPLRPAGPVPPPRAVPTLLLPRGGAQLPPKIYYPSPHEVTAHKPTLPPLNSKQSLHRSDPLTSSSSTEEPQTETSDENPNLPTPAAGPSRRPELPIFATPNPPKAPVPSVTSDAKVTEDEPLPSDEFQNLNLQDRFWLRLNALAVESHQAALQRQADLAAANLSQVENIPETGASPAGPFAGEVVVYEDETPADSFPTTPEQPEPHQGDPVSPPTPVIDLPEGELLVGAPLLLNVRVPIHFNRLYLKLWIMDPQTRTLVDEPRQLMHLSPDGYGNLSASVQLSVPQGCLEAQIEAIAVDMVTQQESYKTSIRRPVVTDDVKRFDSL